MRQIFAAVVMVAALAGCTEPPPSAYVAGAAVGSGHIGGLALGPNAAHEACTLLRNGATGSVYCGTWQQPSAQIAAAGSVSPAELPGLAAAGAWRTALDSRYRCDPPQATTILAGSAAQLLQCTQRVGGWPHVALVASIGGQGWYADGVLPALPAMERAIGVMAGQISPAAASAAVVSAADELLASRLAAQAFSSGDVGRYDQLMTVAAQANAAENFAGAEAAYRAALALQRKALGANDPNTALTLMDLAIQISDQGRYPEAATLFGEAAALAPRAADPSTTARLDHYEALSALNEGDLATALRLLRTAQAGYARLLPAAVLHAKPAPDRVGSALAGPGAGQLIPNRDLLTDLSTRASLTGLIEVRRYLSIVLRRLGQHEASLAALRSAETLAAGNGITQPVLMARLARTSASDLGAAGEHGPAANAYGAAVSAFAQAIPDSRPVAETELLRAGQLVDAGEPGAALGLCRHALTLLRELKLGTRATLIDPCLDAYAASAQGADRQALLAEMFEASQLAQGTVTSNEIAQATARLAANARDPKVGAAIRARQDAAQALGQLYRERDRLQQIAGQSAATADLEARIAKARARLASADAALQAAAPNYGQLVQQVVSAKQVFAALRPGEAFVDTVLGPKHGWSFLLRNGILHVAQVPGGTARMSGLVQRIRASIESDSAAPPPFDVADAHALYQDLFGGFGPAFAGTHRLVVAPSGPLLSLPFALLLTGPGKAGDLGAAPWLIREMTVAHVPAAANFVSLRRIAGTSRATQPWFGFGAFRRVTLAQARASFGPRCGDSAQLFAGLPPLPYATRELAAARALLGASGQDELLGPAFTAAAVEHLPLDRYRILHFATHALLPTDLACQNEPAIVTSAPAGATNASGALLTASEVTGLHLDANAVILSACNTGGPAGGQAGESLSGLARAFFYAGARALVVTHWSVNDQTAAYLVADTLSRYAARPSAGLGGALRSAELAMIDGAGKDLPAGLSHPFYWAPFALIGDGGGEGGRTAALPPAPGKAPL